MPHFVNRVLVLCFALALPFVYPVQSQKPQPDPSTGPIAPTDAQASSRALVTFDVHQSTLRIAKAYTNRTVDIVDAQSGQILVTIPGPVLGFESNDSTLLRTNDISFSPDGNKLAISFGGFLGSGFVWIVDTGTGALQQELESGAYSQSVAWSSGSLMLAGISSYGYGSPLQSNYLVVWDIQTSTVLMERRLDSVVSSALDWSSTDASILALTDGNQLKVFDVSLGTLSSTLTDTTQPYLTSVEWNPDGTMIAATGETYVVIWNPSSPDPVATFAKLGSESVASPTVAWSPDGVYVASSSGSTVEAWNVQDQVQVFHLDTEVNVTNIVWQNMSSMYYDGADVQLAIPPNMESPPASDLFSGAIEMPDAPGNVCANTVASATDAVPAATWN